MWTIDRILHTCNTMMFSVVVFTYSAVELYLYIHTYRKRKDFYKTWILWI